MTKYDNFTPTIPETEDAVRQEELPVQEQTAGPTGRPRRKREPSSGDSTKQKKQKSPDVKIEKESLPQRIKNWAAGQTPRWITGLILVFFGIYLTIAMMSYFDTCLADQSEIFNTEIGRSGNVENKAGEGGARVSEFLINQCFGLGSFVIVFWLLAMAVKLLTGWPRFKTVNFTIKCMVALITVSLIVGLLTIGLQSPANWGGYHGRYVNEFVVHFLGWSGALVLCVFMVALFVVICMRDVINWIIAQRKKYAERRRIKREEEEEARRRELELEALRAQEQSQNAVEEEPAVEDVELQLPEDQKVSFDDGDMGLYSSLPEFEETTSDTQVDRDFCPEGLSGYVIDNSSIHENSERSSGVDLGGDENMAYMPADESDCPDAVVDEMVVNVNTISQTNGNSGEVRNSWEHPWKFPPAELLREGSESVCVDALEQMENKEKIKSTLLDFGIPILSIEATVGPTVTLYEIVPERGVKINRIRSLGDDIALRIAATGVRIIAPIPGKNTVGIEVANKDPQTVSMRTIIKSKVYQEKKMKLPVAIGSTISNEVFITDLAKMPHLLVAGATGQGKSVGLNAIIASLLYKKTPDELKFVMVDPKMVEFSLYAKIEKHYLAKIPDAEDAIITDMDKVVATLSSLCVEMDDRYQLLKAAHTRNIEEYNDKFKSKILNPFEGHRYLPYIVVVVDEFSDLIMTAGKEVEIPIARLAQKARAVGMHVIVATQRPSTNVITGIIKANFPARIAFKVSSGVDSKTILDTPGAQQLIGRGDMLVSNNGPMVRVQCAFIDTPEVEAICDYIERQPYGQGAYLLPEPVNAGSGSGDNDSELGNNFGDKDPLFEEVARLIVSSNTASTSSLQRRYSIGYNRAGKIMDQLEAAGIVGPAHGGKPRAVLVDSVSLESILNP